MFWRVDDKPCYLRPESGKILFSPCDETLMPPQAPPKDMDALTWVGERIAETIPSLGDAEVTTYWAGLRTFAADRWPILGSDPRVPGLHWCAGLGGHGMTIGLGAGAQVAQAVRGFGSLCQSAIMSSDSWTLKLLRAQHPNPNAKPCKRCNTGTMASSSRRWAILSTESRDSGGFLAVTHFKRTS